MYSFKLIPYIKKNSVFLCLCVNATKDLDNDSNDKFLLHSVAFHNYSGGRYHKPPKKNYFSIIKLKLKVGVGGWVDLFTNLKLHWRPLEA